MWSLVLYMLNILPCMVRVLILILQALHLLRVTFLLVSKMFTCN